MHEKPYIETEINGRQVKAKIHFMRSETYPATGLYWGLDMEIRELLTISIGMGWITAGAI
jgi:hypothetical protein